MSTATTETPHASTRTGAGIETGPDLTLEVLAHLCAEELREMYEAAVVPSSMKRLSGSPPGRFLAMRGPIGCGLPAAALRQVTGSRFFPWAGKTFGADSDEQGWGVNRLIVIGDLYRFQTRFEPSAVDGKPCIVLDYDNPGNPFFVRAVHDELREVRPGLFMGPAMIKTPAEPMLVLWFAVDNSAS